MRFNTDFCSNIIQPELHMQQNRFLVNLLVIAIAFGIFFRFYAIDHKLYWHDEVYTSMRATGFTGMEIDRTIFQNRLLTVADLQKYQKIKPNSSAADTIYSLSTEDPQHPPLYFLMARAWMQIFGSAISASRFLPALLSLLSLPLIYGLSVELWGSSLVGMMAMALLALSPFDVLFAQTARQYSLLTVCTIASGWVLLRAMRLQTWQAWSIYTLSVTIGLYTHPFFGLSVIGHGVFVLAAKFASDRQPISINISPLRNSIKSFASALVAALIIYLPWLLVLFGNYKRAANSTSWANAPVNLLYMIKLWLLSFTSLFFDLDLGFDNFLTYLLRLPIAILIAASIYTICQLSDTDKSTQITYNVNALFIVTSIFVPFLLLAIPDLVLGALRSSVSRYLISCFPAVQLAVAFFATRCLTQLPRRYMYKLGILVLMTGSIASCTVSALSNTWWHKVPSYHNAEISDRVNSFTNPVLVSDIGDDYTNTGDLISLSYSLDPKVQLLLLNRPTDWNFALKTIKNPAATILIFRPSKKLLDSLPPGSLDLIYPPGRLLQFSIKP